MKSILISIHLFDRKIKIYFVSPIINQFENFMKQSIVYSGRNGIRFISYLIYGT